MPKQSIREAIENLRAAVAEALDLDDEDAVDVSFNVVMAGEPVEEYEDDSDDEEEDDEEYEDDDSDDEDEDDDEDDSDDDDEDDESDEDDDEEEEELTEEDLKSMNLGELRALAKEYGISTAGLKKAEIIEAFFEEE